jgi:hypothetical protein
MAPMRGINSDSAGYFDLRCAGWARNASIRVMLVMDDDTAPLFATTTSCSHIVRGHSRQQTLRSGEHAGRCKPVAAAATQTVVA